MLRIIRNWIDRLFAEEETVVLLLLLLVGLLLIVTLGNVLAPVIASLVFAFMMQGMIATLVAWRAPRWLAITLAYLLFMGLFFGFIFGLMPLVWKQLTSLIQELPVLLRELQKTLMQWPERSDLISEAQVRDLVGAAGAELGKLGQRVVSFSIAQLPNLLGVLIYLILVPILVFFFLKDKDQILDWLKTFLPHRRPLMAKIWIEMNDQVANYVRGKGIEIVIVGSATYVSFIWLDLNYAALLALLVGMSVVIPYIGAAVVTIPVVIVGYLQWGVGPEFYTLLFVYGLIQAIDGNVLVPLLFSEVVNMHPVAIILSVLVFGGVWGLWGVFFAIPLATLVKAILNAWPTPGTLSSSVTLQEEKV
ncbi:AI-2E family transporter [Litorivivens sp.]|uniref:AI-2E family transporter n=1 Tax=Litorivivens sp. TaxID=2020868 RepID=UPI00356334DE